MLMAREKTLANEKRGWSGDGQGGTRGGVVTGGLEEGLLSGGLRAEPGEGKKEG